MTWFVALEVPGSIPFFAPMTLEFGCLLHPSRDINVTTFKRCKNLKSNNQPTNGKVVSVYLNN